MRILIVNSVFGQGSTGKIVEDLYQRLCEEGNEVKVCYGRGQCQNNPNIVKVGYDFETIIHATLARIMGISGCFSYFSTKKLINIIEQFNPDIVHLHNVHGYYMDYYKVVKYLKKKKMKVVWTLHDELMFTGNCDYAYECDLWQTGCHACEQIESYPKSLFFDFSSIQYKWKHRLFMGIEQFEIVTPSAWLKNRVEQSIMSEANVAVIHNGIDVNNVYYPQSSERERENQKIVLIVTDDLKSVRKGLNYSLKLADICANTHPEVVFWIVGGTDENNNRENVKYFGMIKDKHELAKIYSKADILLITSQCDNFPTVCIEALACGTPILGFNAGGIAETAPHKRIGTFVSKNDMDSLRDALYNMLGWNREQTRIECRKFAEKEYSRELMIDRYMNMYNRKI